MDITISPANYNGTPQQSFTDPNTTIHVRVWGVTKETFTSNCYNYPTVVETE